MNLEREPLALLRGKAVLVPFSQSLKARAVVDAFAGLLEESPEELARWEHTRPELAQAGAGADDGCFRRDRSGKDGETHDRKWCWHYRLPTRTILAEQGANITRHQALLELSHDLYAACFQTLFILARTIEHEQQRRMTPFPILLTKRLESGLTVPESHVLRVNLYDEARAPDTWVAKPHSDRDFMTLHVYESECGFHVKSHDAYVPVETAPGTALAFAGRKLSRDTDGVVPALFHGACSNGRRASVAFFAQSDTVLPPKQGAT